MGPRQWRWHWHMGEWLEGALLGAVLTANQAPGAGAGRGGGGLSWACRPSQGSLSVSLHKVRQ